MSLPAALKKRLSQRGILNTGKNNACNTLENYNEEIIAEDYDELDAVRSSEEVDSEYFLYKNENENSKTKTSEENFWIWRMKERMGVASSYLGYKNCPNKYNIWHKCTLYCVKRWENGRPEPSEKYMQRYKRMLRKYPLSNGWIEKYDPGCGCYYFLNPEDKLVSWLPPSHPKSRISKSAATYRSKLDNSNYENDDSKDSCGKPGDSSSSLPDNCTSPSSALLSDCPKELDDDVKSVSKKQKYRDIERTISRKRKDGSDPKDHDFS